MTDRREELGLDPEGLRAKRCLSCEEITDVETVTDDSGNQLHFCSVCRRPVGAQAPGSFAEPGPIDL